MPDGKSRVVYVWQSYDRKSAAGTSPRESVLNAGTSTGARKG